MIESKKILIVFIFSMYGLTACYLEENKTSMPLPHEIFSINPATILDDISNGKKDVFVPFEKPIFDSETEYVPVTWTHDNYMTIANSAHEFVWGEELGNWKINSILFDLQCQEEAYGSQSVYLTFFKLIENNVEENRLVHNIVIQPRENMVGAWAERYSHLTATWEEYYISGFKITSDEALRIAENNGGKEFRERKNNDCTISISMNRKIHNNGDWLVTYYTDKNNLEFIIDPNTGEYRVNNK